ncbi:NtaA/DmoA family FMN-dependent monooxygenase [Zavarzinia compransoris]|uniref:FMNH2-dependent monooxygenase n=1 Tax=Zavarzinia compransoris TaxID=1264899 RepID=A0A317E3X3_9PROT|nr:NtaA/DmoA family FMN-dependent monooxygenase [Zavarzinia compransoris]PWR20910.1 FMNH2-dependent monooxygenase [Zavarzinia compransoris]TDP44252.1 FMN-dependent oxidoreductase (nitrilotriacetate monooxygenase family) [Zavarzinia compransoris]
MAKPFHLGWFTNFATDEWNGPFSNGGDPWNGKFYVEMAQALERACFDYIMFEDKLAISEIYGGTSEAVLKHGLGMVPKGDPAPLVAMIAGATSKIGVVATLSTLGYPPFLLARLCSTIDSLADGRFGWNIVTSAENAAAQNFGLDALPPRELRYDMAHEYLDLVLQLFNSWEPDAVVRDRETGTYADFTKVKPIHFEGRFFKCRGPLNCVRSPQGVPTLIQAGASPKGRDFAAKYADAIVAVNQGIPAMKAFRDDIRQRAAAHGRDPDEVKVLFLVAPTLAETVEDAQAKYDRMATNPSFIEMNLCLISSITDIDFKAFDLDRPLPEKLVTNGEQGSLDSFQQWGSGKTLRQLVTEASGGLVSSIPLVGTPDTVADRMGEVAAAVGGDGFLITTPHLGVNRRIIHEVTDGLVPALQRRGLMRTDYSGKTLRENLRAF